VTSPAIEALDVAASYDVRGAPTTGVPKRGARGDGVLEDVSLRVEAGQLCAVLGPNGAGKSTLLRVLAGVLVPASGHVRIWGDEIASLDRREIARRIAVVHQQASVAFGFSVRDVVAMGRAPHQGAWMRANGRDEELVERALAACELDGLRDRPVAHLSGGEQKRVAIARALAQDAQILLLDEPGAHLDVRHLVAVHELLRREIERRRLACVAVLHDMNIAAEYADRVVLMKAGRLVAHGTVEEVMTYRRLKEVFETELWVGVNELDGARYFLPVRPRSRPSGDRDL
jgi:iron complex transport system ATP-binding protein